MSDQRAIEPGEAAAGAAAAPPAAPGPHHRRRHGRSGRIAGARHPSAPGARPRSAATAVRPAGTVASGDGMLKLMLILLAFFVYLHGQSTPSEERAASVLSSLAARFAGLPVTSGLDDPALAGEALDRPAELRRRLVGHLPVTAMPRTEPGTIVGFDLAADDLFAPDHDTVRRERLVLLHRLAEALRTAPAKEGLLLVITTAAPPRDGAAGDPVAGDREAASGTIRRLSALASSLREAGLDTGRLRLGFGPVPEATWRFAVRPDDADGG